MERNRELWSEHNDRVVAGLCMGTLPAIAAAASFSETDLLSMAPEFVQLSLRIGLEVSRRTLALEYSSESWSFSVSGVSLETLREDLRRFNQSKVSSQADRAKSLVVAEYLPGYPHQQAGICERTFEFFGNAERATFSSSRFPFFRTNAFSTDITTSDTWIIPCLPFTFARA